MLALRQHGLGVRGSFRAALGQREGLRLRGRRHALPLLQPIQRRQPAAGSGRLSTRRESRRRLSDQSKLHRLLPHLIKECVYRAELDMETLVWTRGRSFPLSRLETRLRSPMCGSRDVRLIFTVPREAQTVRGAKPGPK